MLPRPVQQPHPPLWLTVSREPAHARWAGEQGLNLMTLPWNLPSFAMTRTVIEEYRAALRRAGRRGQVLAMYPTHVGKTLESARREVDEHWAAFRDMAASLNAKVGIIDSEPMSFDRMVGETRAIFGDPATCRQHVDCIRSELDLDRLALLFHFGGLSQERVLASMRLFAHEVAPRYVAEPAR